jgi:hypothetical protein
MPTLSETLERFNRKERNLLVRDILGQKDEIHPPLSEDFCARVRESLGLDNEVPPNAWWATDYHINWLAGALTIHAKGESVINQPFPNPLLLGEEGGDVEETAIRKLVEGNQEDVDLLIVNDCDLIMIEAKAYDDFTHGQINSKLARLNLLHMFYRILDPLWTTNIRFFLAFQGPKNPKALLRNIDWPKWIANEKDRAWIELRLNRPLAILEVTRCDQNGHSSQHGLEWKTFVSKHNAKPSQTAINPS